MLAAVATAMEVAAVSGTTKPAGLTVHRMRDRPLNVESLPAIVVYWGGDLDPTPDVTDLLTRTARVLLEVRVKQAGAPPDSVLDPLLVWAVKAMMADYTLSGASVDMEELRSDPNLTERIEGLAAAVVEFHVRYRTTYKDPETT